MIGLLRTKIAIIYPFMKNMLFFLQVLDSVLFVECCSYCLLSWLFNFSNWWGNNTANMECAMQVQSKIQAHWFWWKLSLHLYFMLLKHIPSSTLFHLWDNVTGENTSHSLLYYLAMQCDSDKIKMFGTKIPTVSASASWLVGVSHLLTSLFIIFAFSLWNR